jgi:hypothetical protein
MEENIDGFVFKRKKKKRKVSNNKQNTNTSLSNFITTSSNITASTTRKLPPISNALPAYPETNCPTSVRGLTFDNVKSSMYEKDSHRLINLLNNVINKEMESINKAFPADGPYGLFNILATHVSSDFLTKSKSILLASAKQQEMRAKSNAPYVRPLPLNDQLRKRETVLNSLIDKFEREKESWEKASGKADEEATEYHQKKMLLHADNEDGEANGSLKFSKPDIVLGSEMSETLKRFVVQIDQIYEVLEKSRKSGESLEKQRKSLSEAIHATAHYNGAGSSLDMIKGLTSTSKNDGALIRAFTKASSDAIMGGNNENGTSDIPTASGNSLVTNNSKNALSENSNNVSIISDNEMKEKEIIEQKEKMVTKINPLNILKNMTA